MRWSEREVNELRLARSAAADLDEIWLYIARRENIVAGTQRFASITSVDLITTVTVSPFLSASCSALRRVITLSMWFFPIRTQREP
jgi:hypothetical protein